MKENELRLPDSFPCNDVDEQETVITYMRGDKCIEIYTSDNTTLTKLRKLVCTDGSVYKLKRVEYMTKRNEETGEETKLPVSVIVCAPMNCLSLRAGKKRELTEEEREALRERMKAVNAKRLK
jgi:hypothetical protein